MIAPAPTPILPPAKTVWDLELRAHEVRRWLRTRDLHVRETWNFRTVYWGETAVQGFDRQANNEFKQTYQLIAESADRKTRLSWDLFPWGPRRGLKWCVRLGIEDGVATGGCCSFATEAEARECFDRHSLVVGDISHA